MAHLASWHGRELYLWTPAGHPAWNAPLAERAGWWRDNREGMLAPRREPDPPPAPEKP